MKSIYFDDLDPGDTIKVFLRSGGHVVGKVYGIVKGKPDSNDKRYYLEINTGPKKIKAICTADIFRLVKLP